MAKRKTVAKRKTKPNPNTRTIRDLRDQLDEWERNYYDIVQDMRRCEEAWMMSIQRMNPTCKLLPTKKMGQSCGLKCACAFEQSVSRAVAAENRRKGCSSMVVVKTTIGNDAEVSYQMWPLQEDDNVVGGEPSETD